jgi:5-formyltetrahydrofolate cyclo-ligase
MHFLVLSFKQSLQNELVGQLYKYDATLVHSACFVIAAPPFLQLSMCYDTRLCLHKLMPNSPHDVCTRGFMTLTRAVPCTVFYREQVMADLMRETEDVASKRRAFREMRELLRSALDIVNEVRIVLAT